MRRCRPHQTSDRHAEETFDVELPVRFKQAGYYPTKYSIAYATDPMTGMGYYTVTIEDLVWRDAS